MEIIDFTVGKTYYNSFGELYVLEKIEATSVFIRALGETDFTPDENGLITLYKSSFVKYFKDLEDIDTFTLQELPKFLETKIHFFDTFFIKENGLWQFVDATKLSYKIMNVADNQIIAIRKSL